MKHKSRLPRPIINNNELSVYSLKTSDNYSILVSAVGNSSTNVCSRSTLLDISLKLARISRDDICSCADNRDVIEAALMQEECTLMDLHLTLSSEETMHVYNIIASNVTKSIFDLDKDANENLTTVLYADKFGKIQTLCLDVFNNTGYLYEEETIQYEDGSTMNLAKPVKQIKFTTEDLMLTLLNDILIRIELKDKGLDYYDMLARIDNTAELIFRG